MNGALILNKDTNYTSRDVINVLNKILNTKKIGHTGTLDPMAKGVLVCLIGKYTKLVPLIMSEEKEYIAEIKLGIKTDTLDITGDILETSDVPCLNKDFIIDVLNSFIGTYKETVPLYSAVWVNGRRLYDYARNKIDVSLPTKEVYIKEINLLEYQNNIIKFKVIVSKGTYIRSLIQSICEKLNVVGTMNSLIRTKQGNFTINDTYTLDDVKNGNYKLVSLENLIPLKKIELNKSLENKVLNGNKLEEKLDGYILFIKNNQEVALYYFENNIGKLIILF